MVKLALYLAALVALIGAVVGDYYAGHRAGANAVTIAWQADKIVQAKQYVIETNNLRAKETARDQQLMSLQQDQADANARLSDNYMQLALSLQKRPDRPVPAANTTPTNAPAPAAGTGAGLFAEDAGFLAGEATRAEQLRIALDTCYNQYAALGDHQ